MASYRFCRPDDIPLLVEAVNRCYLSHFPEGETLTIEGFRNLMRSLDVWPSNCMVALSHEVPIAILIGTKREAEVLVMYVGVHRDFQRQGHALHIVTSLGQKLAVLGPPRLLAEPPRDQPGACELFRAAGFELEGLLLDYRHENRSNTPPVPDGLIFPITHSELQESGSLSLSPDRAWIRSPPSLSAQAASLQGRAIGTPLGIDAYVLLRENQDQGILEVLSAHCGSSEQGWVYLELLLRGVLSRSDLPVCVPSLGDQEIPQSLLEGLGFKAVRRIERVSTEAKPG